MWCGSSLRASFLGIETTITNVMKEQEVTVYPDGSNHPSAFVAGGGKGETVMMVPDYLIPDIRSHLFITVNSEGSYPASDATWLANKPLVSPGRPELLIGANESSGGMMVFTVPNDSVHQLSLHLFDAANGSVHVPIIGEMSRQTELVLDLPDSEGMKLSDTLALSISSVSDGEVGFVEYENDDTIYREVEALLTSKVGALLELEPSERIHLTIPTDDGAFWIDVHEGTSLIPYGHYQKRRLAPGSNNKSRWIFEIPDDLAVYGSGLNVELADEDVNVTVSEGDVVPLGMDAAYSAKGDGYELRIMMLLYWIRIMEHWEEV